MKDTFTCQHNTIKYVYACISFILISLRKNIIEAVTKLMLVKKSVYTQSQRLRDLPMGKKGEMINLSQGFPSFFEDRL